MRTVTVPAKLTGFAARLVRVLDDDDEDRFIDADDAVQSSFASGGRIGPSAFFIAYAASRKETWSLRLDEPTLRRLAAGLIKKLPVEVSVKAAAAPRARAGDAFAIWGEGPTDRCMVLSREDLERLIAGLSERACSQKRVATAIFGSTFGDIVYAAISPDGVHVGVVLRGGAEHRISTKGNAEEVEPQPARFPFLDEDLPLSYADYVPIGAARPVLTALVLHGEIVRDVEWTGAMLGALLVDLPALLQARGLTVPLAEPFPPLAASGWG